MIVAFHFLFISYSCCYYPSLLTQLQNRGGMIAPLLGGTLLMIDGSFPVWASVVVFLIAGFCVLLLSEKEGGKRGSRGGAVLH